MKGGGIFFFLQVRSLNKLLRYEIMAVLCVPKDKNVLRQQQIAEAKRQHLIPFLERAFMFSFQGESRINSNLKHTFAVYMYFSPVWCCVAQHTNLILVPLF